MKTAAAKDSWPPFVLDLRFGECLNRRVPFAKVVETEVDDDVFAQMGVRAARFIKRRKILVAP